MCAQHLLKATPKEADAMLLLPKQKAMAAKTPCGARTLAQLKRGAALGAGGRAHLDLHQVEPLARLFGRLNLLGPSGSIFTRGFQHVAHLLFLGGGGHEPDTTRGRQATARGRGCADSGGLGGAAAGSGGPVAATGDRSAGTGRR